MKKESFQEFWYSITRTNRYWSSTDACECQRGRKIILRYNYRKHSKPGNDINFQVWKGQRSPGRLNSIKST
jgi:hypothetical protein